MNIAKAVVMFLWGALEASLLWGMIVFPVPVVDWNAPVNSETWKMMFPLLFYASLVGMLFGIVTWIYYHWND